MVGTMAGGGNPRWPDSTAELQLLETQYAMTKGQDAMWLP